LSSEFRILPVSLPDIQSTRERRAARLAEKRQGITAVEQETVQE